ncbi:DJ-1/PfpI family protein [Thermosporothrix hazakensis]|jgi:transcriptional regulator GlxA family with amidase domain|uniref:DJ-1/PfpI family protein n=1 Tax=Thermosporothrix hazakensis TaxID=644383 RepID=A0A326U7K9_THEHA|nr:DJ-1/PfpI family protein [Thermosporothrix hazakensis]PZW27062.1 DJ-1/PfpI family protein [Thermosporothrix hazakensis]GCE50347.1 AraC family transcriptional regulator [Thermosporothrix hazakensis]
MTRNVAILLFEQVELLDFTGPFDVFAVAGNNQDAPFQVYTIAEEARPIITRYGVSVNPAFTLENCPAPDILVVPGGNGAQAVLENPRLLAWIREQHERVELLLSVCTGALVLAKAGLLKGLSATTHHSLIDKLRELAPETTIFPEKRYVDNGKIVLSAGVSAGIDMALYVVARLLGEEKARETARRMQYDHWQGPIF